MFAFYLIDITSVRDVAVYSGVFIGLIYFLFSDAMPNGQSIGKKLLNIQVVNASNKQPCTLLESFLRNITFPLGLFDWVFIFFGQHKRLGDFIASTIVIKKKVNIAKILSRYKFLFACRRVTFFCLLRRK